MLKPRREAKDETRERDELICCRIGSGFSSRSGSGARPDRPVLVDNRSGGTHLFHKLMRSLIVLIFLLVAAAPRAAEREATAIVSKDSLVFQFTVPDVGARWERNNLPKGTMENVHWVFDFQVPEPVTWPFSEPSAAYFAIFRRSAGPPAEFGDLAELLEDSRVLFSLETDDGDAETALTTKTVRSTCYPGWETSSRTVCLGARARVLVDDYYLVEMMARLRPEAMTLKGIRADGSTYEEAVIVQNLRDPREAKARTIAGPFSPDEYAIYQTVIDHAFGRHSFEPGQEVLILNPSVDAALFHTPTNLQELLLANDETLDDFMQKRSIKTDLASLTALGHDVADAAKTDAERRTGQISHWPCTVRVSRVGFNSAGDQALLYCDYGKGNLGGEGVLILLDRVEGEWRITRRVSLWIS
ncbi:MAG TPA: hypothetical protein VFX92_00725 [Candidatus Krumholzibacteria bacterium]|nr:hypothetical protein [Candidatus Krumholzibacteria bacterium]